MRGSEITHELAVDSIYTALLQIMEKKPYEQISITDITRRAGVSRMAYYRNYESKDEILTKRLDKTIDSIIEKIDRGEYKSKEDGIEDFFTVFRSETILQTIVKAGLVDKLVDAHMRLMMEVYKKVYRLDLSIPENMMKLYAEMGSMVGMILYCAEYGDDKDSTVVARLLSSFG